MRIAEKWLIEFATLCEIRYDMALLVVGNVMTEGKFFYDFNRNPSLTVHIRLGSLPCGVQPSERKRASQCPSWRQQTGAEGRRSHPNHPTPWA